MGFDYKADLPVRLMAHLYAACDLVPGQAVCPIMVAPGATMPKPPRLATVWTPDRPESDIIGVMRHHVKAGEGFSVVKRQAWDIVGI